MCFLVLRHLSIVVSRFAERTILSIINLSNSKIHFSVLMISESCESFLLPKCFEFHIDISK